MPISNALPPCNCVLHVTQGAPWLNLTALDGQVIARYVAGDPDGDMEALEWAIARGKADGMGYPVIAYWTRRGQSVRVPAGVDILGVEAYRGLDESVAQFEARLNRACKGGLPVILLAQCYTSNLTQTDDLLSIVPVVARVARRHANVIGIVGFSGSGRATGYQDHPEVHGAWRELFAGIPGVPAIVGSDEPATPNPAPTAPQPPARPPAPVFSLRRLKMSNTQIVGIRVSGQMLSLPQGGTTFGRRPYDQPQGNEKAELSWPEGPDGDMAVRYIDGDAAFSVNDEGGIETRPPGTFGKFERFRGGLLTETTGVLFRAADVGRPDAPLFEVVVWGGQS